MWLTVSVGQQHNPDDPIQDRCVASICEVDEGTVHDHGAL
jgi:hypothetical protein